MKQWCTHRGMASDAIPTPTFFLSLFMLLSAANAFSQSRFAEQDDISLYPVGLYYQPGPGADNTNYNWQYPFGTKLTIVHNSSRNLEFVTFAKDAEGLAFRQFSQAQSAWTPWRRILSENHLGRVMVGNITAQAKLHVHEETELGTSAGNHQLLMQVSGAPGSGHVFRRNLWLVRNETGSTWQSGGIRDGVSIDFSYNVPATSRTWWERDPHNNIQSWGHSGNTYMTLSNGKVGIGVDDPAERLEVAGNVRFRVNSSGYTPDNVGGLFIENDGQANNFFVFQTATLGGGKSFSITNAGNIGIGTTTPDEKLTVKGKIHAEEVRIDLSVPGPDYVFEKDYPLLSLDELKKYIDEYKHLPEVPSAKEMEEHGVDLGEMNMILLRKVEELTLYLMKQDVRIRSLEEENASLRNQQDKN